MFIKEIKYVWVEKWKKRILLRFKRESSNELEIFGATLENVNFLIRRLKPGTS